MRESFSNKVSKYTTRSMEGLEGCVQDIFKWLFGIIAVAIISMAGYDQYKLQKQVEVQQAIIEQQAITITRLDARLEECRRSDPQAHRLELESAAHKTTKKPGR